MNKEIKFMKWAIQQGYVKPYAWKPKKMFKQYKKHMKKLSIIAAIAFASCGPSKSDILNQMKWNEEERFQKSQALLDRMIKHKSNISDPTDEYLDSCQTFLDSMNAYYGHINDSLQEEYDNI